jgi:hypothetical protein
VTGSCELGNEISGSVKGGNFGDQLNENYNLLHGSYFIMFLS